MRRETCGSLTLCIGKAFRKARMPDSFCGAYAAADKNEALPRTKMSPVNQASFDVRVNFAAHRSLPIRAVQTAVRVAEK